MKKTIAMIAMLMMVPLAAHAKTAISDSDLGSVTGQAGVSINLDVTMNVTMDSAAWGDKDGLGAGSNTTEGWIGMTGFNASNVKVHARTDYLATPEKLQFLTIDVATAGAGNANAYAVGTTFVRLGLGTMEISADSISFDVALGTAGTKAALTQKLGSMYIGGMDLKFHEDSYVDIMASQLTGQTGVTFNAQVKVDTFHADAMSWGNAAGAYNSGTAGYIGYANMDITDLELNGQVSINVATANAAAIPGAAGDTNYWSRVYGGAAIKHAAYDIAYATSIAGAVDPLNPTAAEITAAQAAGAAAAAAPAGAALTATLSYVHIGLGDQAGNPFTIKVGSFSSDIKVGNNAGLTGALNSATLGSMYAENVNFGISGWVDITAH